MSKKIVISTRRVVVSGVRVTAIYGILSADGSHFEDTKQMNMDLPPTKAAMEGALKHIIDAKEKLQAEIDNPPKK